MCFLYSDKKNFIDRPANLLLTLSNHRNALKDLYLTPVTVNRGHGTRQTLKHKQRQSQNIQLALTGQCDIIVLMIFPTISLSFVGMPGS